MSGRASTGAADASQGRTLASCGGGLLSTDEGCDVLVVSAPDPQDRQCDIRIE